MNYLLVSMKDGKTIKKYESFNRFKELESILLEHDGDQVNQVFEEDIEQLIGSGDFYDSDDYSVILYEMDPSKCHRNSTTFYENWMDQNNSPDEISLMTGWALGIDDGVWRQHSWIYFPYDGEIIETTILRKSYYGIELKGSKLRDFLFDNY